MWPWCMITAIETITKTQSFLLNLGQFWLVWLGSLLWGFPVCLPCAGLTGGYHPNLAFMSVLGISTFVPHTCVASIFSAKPSLQMEGSFLVTLAVLGSVFLHYLCFIFAMQFYIFRVNSACLVQIYTVY